jgi:twitching motility protein PilT
MNILDVLRKAVEMKGSDVHVTVAVPPMMRINGELRPYGDVPLTPQDTKEIASQILDEEQVHTLETVGEVDLSYILPGISRFRVNAYKQRGSIALAIRIIWLRIPTIDQLGLPEILKDLALKPRGLILVTGPTGSGKSTTLAAMVDHMNTYRNCHIITIEEPIEYLHNHGRCMINQREIGHDSKSFANALRSALREDPDVILVGEMRDLETIATAITAAETGHLVLSTLHTTGAALTIDRVIDVFPPHQQEQIRVQLAGVLEGVVSQLLLPRADKSGMIAAIETMVATGAISNLIREGKTYQIPTVMQTGSKFGMKTMDHTLSEMVINGLITREEAFTRCMDTEMLRRYLLQGGDTRYV